MNLTQADQPSSVLVYGAGGMGLRTVRALRQRGVEVLALLDRQAQPGSVLEGLPVVSPQNWLAARHARGATPPVVIAIHNPAHSVAQVQQDLQAQGFGPVHTPVDVCRWFPEALPDSYWLADPRVYAEHTADLNALSAMLADDASRAVLQGIVALRAEGRYAALGAPEASQYFPASLPRWPAPLRLVDCGAFDGDTLLAAQAAGYTIEQALCLEPDPHNYRKLVSLVRDQRIPAICLPCAVARHACLLHFEAEGAGSSHVRADGAVQVQALGLDEAFPAFAPTLLKMDIEGAEPQALEGAAELIRKVQPGLAIAVYHHYRHLWEIPLLLQRWLPRHRYFLRAHAHNSFDVVLYAQALPPT